MNLFKLVEQEREDITKVLAEVNTKCTDCRLSLLHPDNKGLLYRGNPLASMACLAEAPGDTETERGIPLVGRSGMLFEKWMKYVGLDTRNDMFISNIIQCQPDKVIKEGRPQQRPPDDKEIKACFGPRIYRILKAMPNLEVVLTLGWIAAGTLLGGEPNIKTHEGMWFESELLPGVAIFCMTHPAFHLRDPSMEKECAIRSCLDLFKNEYCEQNLVTSLAKTAKETREKNDAGLF